LRSRFHSPVARCLPASHRQHLHIPVWRDGSRSHGKSIQESIVNRRIHNKQSAALTIAALCVVLPAVMMARPQQGASQTDAQEADETFQARCSTCHAEHGEGSDVGASLNVPDLRSAEVQRNNDSQLRQIIKNGRGNMPAFGRDFSDRQIDRILQLIRSFASPSSQEAQAQTPSP